VYYGFSVLTVNIGTSIIYVTWTIDFQRNDKEYRNASFKGICHQKILIEAFYIKKNLIYRSLCVGYIFNIFSLKFNVIMYFNAKETIYFFLKNEI